MALFVFISGRYQQHNEEYAVFGGLRKKFLGRVFRKNGGDQSDRINQVNIIVGSENAVSQETASEK